MKVIKLKTLNDYLKLPYKMEIIPDTEEEGFTVSFPEPDSLDAYSGQFKLRIPKSLHKQLSEHSKLEGISMNQYCLYLLSKNDALQNKV